MPARRRRAEGFTLVEAAAGFAVLGSVLAVAVPAFVRELRASRFVEPVSGLERLGAHAVAYARERPVPEAFPPSAPLTPSVVPRGVREVDPKGAWEQPTWLALDFRAADEGVPHAYAFAFDSALGPLRSTFVAAAHGDLDGDGVLSTFEIRGHRESVANGADPAVSAAVDPGMYVEAEVE